MDTPQSLSEAVAALCAAMEGQTFIAVSSPVVQVFLLAAGITPAEAPVEAAAVEAPPAEIAPEAAPEPEASPGPVIDPATELVGALTPEEEAHANNL